MDFLKFSCSVGFTDQYAAVYMFDGFAKIQAFGIYWLISLKHCEALAKEIARAQDDYLEPLKNPSPFTVQYDDDYDMVVIEKDNEKLFLSSSDANKLIRWLEEAIA